MSKPILVLYGTSYGQTAKIARHITECLSNCGVVAMLVNGDEPPPDLSIADYRGVIIGASIIVGRHQKCVRRFAREHRDALNAIPSAFFSVSGSAGTRDKRGTIEARKYVDEFLRESGWRPMFIESVAGAVAYTKYNLLVRWVMKQLSKRNAGPIDTSRDYELTDWAQVERFAEAFASALPKGDGDGERRTGNEEHKAMTAAR
jgi:menaquinone-dependent protoporphyrinogen oxidase